MWSDAESTAGILSSCLITYGPLLRITRRKFGILSDKTSSYFTGSKRSMFSSKRSELSSKGSRSNGYLTDKSSKGSMGVTTYVNVDSTTDSQVELTDNDAFSNRSLEGDSDRCAEEGRNTVRVKRDVSITRTPL